MMVYVCLYCGAPSMELPLLLEHMAAVHPNPPFITPIEEEALIAIEERVKHSPEYQEHYTRKVA